VSAGGLVGQSYETNFNATGSFTKEKNASKNSEDQTSEDSDDADSESERQREEDDDEEIWVFRKPAGNANKVEQQMRPAEPVDAYKESLQKLKHRKRLERQKRRNEEKDFSDQDEIDRDVTTVLDIEKLKRLPKLL